MAVNSTGQTQLASFAPTAFSAGVGSGVRQAIALAVDHLVARADPEQPLFVPEGGPPEKREAFLHQRIMRVGGETKRRSVDTFSANTAS